MPFHSTTLSPEALLGQVISLTGRLTRNPGALTPSRGIPFQAQLLQQLMGELDRATLEGAETSGTPLSTRMDLLAALLHPGNPVPNHTRTADPGLPPKSSAPSLPARLPSDPRWMGAHQARPDPELSHSGPTPTRAIPALTSEADGFLGKLAGIAQATAGALGVSPQLLLAQAALETGWGRKTIKDEAGQESFNLFGVKAGAHWTGETVAITTTEYLHGAAQKAVATFRAYGSYAEAFADYAKLIKHRFGDAMRQGASAEGFGRALQAGGYATDPNYARKIAQVAQSVAYRLAEKAKDGRGPG